MAAWEHPDQFRRVISFIGTFVAMNGADTMLAIIRKSGAKANSHFHAGWQESTTSFPGSPSERSSPAAGPISNETLYEDFQFTLTAMAKFELGESGHDGKRNLRHLPRHDALALARPS